MRAITSVAREAGTTPEPVDLTVVVPVYNEGATVRRAVDRLLKAQLPATLEVIVVDDGSTDDTVDQIFDLVRRDEIKLLRHRMNSGKGAALRSGIEAAQGRLLAVLDGDLEYDPRDLALLLRAVSEAEAEAVYGIRTFGGHAAFSFWYVLGNRFLAFCASWIFNSWLRDFTTCLKLAPTELWKSLSLTARGFEVDAEVTAKLLKRGYAIYEVPITYRARGRLEGKKVRALDGLRALWTLLRIRFFRT